MNHMFASLTAALLVCLAAACASQLPEATPSATVNPTGNISPEETDSDASSSAVTAQTNLQTYDETASGIPIQAQYPADAVEAMGTGSGEGVGVFFSFKPTNTHLDMAQVHIFLPAGVATAAEQEPFVTGPGGLMESNGWTVDSVESQGSANFPYDWVETVINFSTDREESGHILLGQTDGQAVQVTLFYPAEMSDAYWPAAKTILDSLEFDASLLPIASSAEE